MNTKNSLKTAGVVVLALAGAGSLQPAQAQTSIRLNGQPLATSAPPISRDGRTLVPMRDIFEALGATVNYNSLTRSINARQGNTQVDLQLDNNRAMVNGRTVTLEQAPSLYGGSTMVPLRFVSEALGADVGWNGQSQIVNISTRSSRGGGNWTADGRNGNNRGDRNNRWNRGDRRNQNNQNNRNDWNDRNDHGQQVDSYRTINIPAGVVVPVTLDSEISSATARVGDPFTATVQSQRLGDSEFPAGSKIEGVISEARRRNGDDPGVLDLDFRTVVLPDGTRYNLNAELTSLDNSNIDTSQQGRIVAKQSDNNDRLKVIGIGAGAGYLIGKVLLKKDGLLSAVLGAAGGFLYDRNRDKNRANEAVLPVGSKIGVKLNSSLGYRDTTDYYDKRSSYLRM